MLPRLRRAVENRLEDGAALHLTRKQRGGRADPRLPPKPLLFWPFMANPFLLNDYLPL